jgi:hypothetical protein
MNARYFVSVLAVLVLGAALPRVTHAQVPDPAQCIVPSHVLVVGTNAAGVPDPIGACTIKVIRLSGTPIRGSYVVLDFANAPDIRVAASQPGANVGAFCDAGLYSSVRGTTASDGTVSFTVIGQASHARPDAGHPSLNIYADGVFLGTVPVAAVDQDGGGLGAADNSLWQSDYFSGQYLERSDFDGDGMLGAADFSLWLAAFFGGGSIANSSTLVCP